MSLLYRLYDWLALKLFGRWFKVTIHDPEAIARIKDEFGIEVILAPLPPEADYSPGDEQ